MPPSLKPARQPTPDAAPAVEHIDTTYLETLLGYNARRVSLKVIELFTGREGIAEVIQTNRFDELGIPLPTQYKGAPDLVIAAKDGYGISGSAVGEYVVPVTGSISAGYHGYLASNPKMNALFVVSGRGVKPGVQLDQVNNVDIAPTIAHLLGLTMPGVEGKVLKEILTETK